MKRLALLLSLLLVLSLCSGCIASNIAVTDPATIPTKVEQNTASVSPTVVEETPAAPDPTPEPAPEPAPTPEPEPEPVPEVPNEGDIDQSTQDQITSLEQSSTVRDDDVAPVEAESYCKLTVTCEELLPLQDRLTDVLLPPDGMFYSGTIVLTGGETALQLIADKVTACGLVCELDEDRDEFLQVAAIHDDQIEDMEWKVFCNGIPLDDPELYTIQSGDVLLLSYVYDD